MKLLSKELCRKMSLRNGRHDGRKSYQNRDKKDEKEEKNDCKKDVKKLLEINDSLQSEILTVRQFANFREEKLKKQMDKAIEELKIATHTISEKDKCINKLKSEYAELETELITFKSRATINQNSLETRITNFIRDNQKLIDLVDILERELRNAQQERDKAQDELKKMGDEKGKKDKEVAKLKRVVEGAKVEQDCNNYENLAFINKELKKQNDCLKIEINSLESKCVNDNSFTNRSQINSSSMEYLNQWTVNDSRRHSLSKSNNLRNSLSYSQNKENNYNQIINDRQSEFKPEQKRDNVSFEFCKGNHAHHATFGQDQFEEQSSESLRKNSNFYDQSVQRTPFKPLISNHSDLDCIVRKYSNSIRKTEEDEDSRFMRSSKVNKTEAYDVLLTQPEDNHHKLL